jgi:hypothetical protein
MTGNEINLHAPFSRFSHVFPGNIPAIRRLPQPAPALQYQIII